MEKHASYLNLSDVLGAYPQRRCVFQAYNDLLLSQRWTNVEVLILPNCGRCAIRGNKPGTVGPHSVIPIAKNESLSPSWLDQTFADLAGTLEFYLAITDEDSSIVYYKICQGIVKPPL